MNPNDKPLVWLAGKVRTPPFSTEARIEAGFLPRKPQQNESLSLPHSRPMPSIGAGCHELRVVDRDKTWRIIYHVDADAVVILDVFLKKTRATPKRVTETCRARFNLYRTSRK